MSDEEEEVEEEESTVTRSGLEGVADGGIEDRRDSQAGVNAEVEGEGGFDRYGRGSKVKLKRIDDRVVGDLLVLG